MKSQNTNALSNQQSEPTATNTNISPCPFCGSNNIAFYDSAPDGLKFVFCRSCGAQMPGQIIQQAIDEWNCRQRITSYAPYSPSIMVRLFEGELCQAICKHPHLTTDAIHASAILHEEAGELTQAAIDFHFHHGDRERMREEVIQVGAMALRFLLNLDSYKPEEKS